MARKNQSNASEEAGRNDIPVYTVGSDMALVATVLPQPECEMPPTDPDAGNHDPQHTFVGDTPVVEWGGTPQHIPGRPSAPGMGSDATPGTVGAP